MPGDKSEILQGKLDLMVLKTLATLGLLHGYGIARRIEQISEEAMQVNQGTIGASLVRLQLGPGFRGCGVRPKTTGERSSTPSRRWAASGFRRRRQTGSGSQV